MPGTFVGRISAVVLLLGAGLACSSQNVVDISHDHAQPAASTSAPYSSTSRIADDLPLLRADLNRGVRPAETTRLVYEFAARHPEVLKYIPCFCGCERGEHDGNDDCFVGARDKSGKVTEWETHGLVCEVCIDVAQQAMQMHNAGVALTAIRAAIDERYAGRPTQMVVPDPPAKNPKNK